MQTSCCRTTYVPRSGTTPDAELAALAAVYRFLLDRHEEDAIEANGDKRSNGAADAEGVGSLPEERPAKGGSSSPPRGG